MTAPKLGAPIHWMAPADTTPVPSRAMEWRGFCALVDTVEQAGLAPPPRYGALLASYGRIQSAATNGHTMQDRLTSAVLRGRDDDYEMLLAAALSERYAAASQLQAGLLSAVRDEVLDALRRCYGEVAGHHYRHLAARFDNAADKFTACSAIIPADSRPDEIINAKPKIQEAWRQAETHANELDQLLEMLSAAAELARPLDQPSGIGGSRDFLLPLCADIDGIHRRTAWNAWTGLPLPKLGGLTRESLQASPPKPVRNRCGRWARMIAAGGIIRAHPNPASLELFDPLAPIGIKEAQVAPNRAGLVPHDPEDDRAPKQRRGPGSLLLDRLTQFGRRAEEPAVEEPHVLDTVLDGDSDTPARDDLRAEGWGV